MVSFLLTFGLGVFLGWVLIPEPVWAQKMWDKVITTVKGWFDKDAGKSAM